MEAYFVALKAFVDQMKTTFDTAFPTDLKIVVSYNEALNLYKKARALCPPFLVEVHKRYFPHSEKKTTNECLSSTRNFNCVFAKLMANPTDAKLFVEANDAFENIKCTNEDFAWRTNFNGKFVSLDTFIDAQTEVDYSTTKHFKIPTKFQAFTENFGEACVNLLKRADPQVLQDFQIQSPLGSITAFKQLLYPRLVPKISDLVPDAMEKFIKDWRMLPELVLADHWSIQD